MDLNPTHDLTPCNLTGALLDVGADHSSDLTGALLDVRAEHFFESSPILLEQYQNDEYQARKKHLFAVFLRYALSGCSRKLADCEASCWNV